MSNYQNISSQHNVEAEAEAMGKKVMEISFGIRLTRNQQQNTINDDERNRMSDEEGNAEKRGSLRNVDVERVEKKGRKGCIGNWYVRCKRGKFGGRKKKMKRVRERFCNARTTNGINKE